MAVQPGLCFTWSETPKTGFLASRLILVSFFQASQVVPEWLENYAKGSVSTAGYVPMGGKFGGKDIRKGVPRVSAALNLSWQIL